MNRLRWLVVMLAAAVIAAAWWQVGSARSGLIVREWVQEGTPLLYLAPADATRAPGVLVAHGFAGSRQLMLGYGYTLAHAGYAVMLWDFAGHGASAAALERDSLQRDLERAYAALIAQREVDAARVALLGHSMGSGAVMTAGILNPDRYRATVAISPTGAEVTADRPRNLLLQAGSWEGRFVANAERLLRAAGGANEDFAAGRARRLIVIPNAEHISILFRAESHRAALDWIGQASAAATTTPYSDRRMLWYLAHLAAWLMLITAAAPLLRMRRPAAGRPGDRGGGWRPWAGLAVGTGLGIGVVGVASRLGPVAQLGGVQVGGAVALWFLAAGLGWLALQRRVARPTGRELGLGVVLFILLSLAFGALAQAVWVPWWLITPRLLRWPFLAIAFLPWFLAAGQAQTGRAGLRLLWWLAQSVATVGGLFLTLLLAPALGFLVLLMPLLPVLLGLLAVAGAAFDRAWTYALGSALFFGWVIAAVFPLAG